MIDRRNLLESLLATASASAMMSIDTSAVSAQGIRSGYGNLPTPDVNQGMGVTDASGLVASFPLRAQGAKQVWVNSFIGSVFYNGLSPYPGYQLNGSGPNYQVGASGPGAPNPLYGPKGAYYDAMNSVTPTFAGGEGNQFFFAEGQIFVISAIAFGIMFYNGLGATYPVCFQSYDPSDPLNVAKHGRAGTGSQGRRPVFALNNTGAWPGNSRGDAVEYGGWVFRGLKWTSSNNGQYSNWLYAQSDMLFENMVFDNVALALENQNSIAGFTTSSNVIVRACASYGQFDTSGQHICGIYSQNVNLTVEDSVFWHCGWRVGTPRDAPVSAGGADIYKHCLYLHNGSGTTSLVRRNVLIDGSASGLSLRGNHVCHHNVIIDCPTPDFKSGGSGSDTESPNGVSQHSYCHLVIGGADITSNNPRMLGYGGSNGTPGSYYAYSLYINNPGYGSVNNQWFIVQNNVAAQITNVGFFSNRAYAFAPENRRLVSWIGPQGSLSSIKIIDSDNVLSTSSPMTNAELYSAIGFINKEYMINAMIADPTRGWAYTLLDAASTGFNFNFNYRFS